MTRKLTKALAILTLIGITLSAYSAFAQEWDRSPAQRSMRGRDDRTEAPAPPPQGRQADDQQDTAARYPDEVRSIDGTANNLVNPLWGSAGVEFLRLTTVGYADESSEPSGDARPNAREISNACAAYDGDAPNTVNASDFLWLWGQFLDHDVAETSVADPAEEFDIEVPAGDPDFDPLNTGEVTIPLDRSHYNIVNGVRQQVNQITAFVDASNVYGSDEERALELRTLDGTGHLKTSEGDLLPFNESGLVNAPSTDTSFFLAGDIRANEQGALTVMHTLFVREHNYWADSMLRVTPGLNGDELYEMARAIVAAEMQRITYNEFLPLLLGQNGLRPYRGYREDVNPGLGNAFAAAAYRVGHTMLSSELLRLEADGSTIEDGNIALADAFFNPDEIINHGIEPYLRGLSAQTCQNVDSYVVDDVRNFLFGVPGAGGFDLASLNIQRGRDHGLPGYNQVRRDYGLSPAQSFADMSSDP